jgi:hypothetical protein
MGLQNGVAVTSVWFAPPKQCTNGPKAAGTTAPVPRNGLSEGTAAEWEPEAARVMVS